MKKRIVLIGLIALLSSLLPLSAGVSKASVTGFYGLVKATGDPDSVSLEGEPPFTQTTHTIGIKVQGTSFFSPTSNFGLSYKTAVSKALQSSVETADGVSLDLDFDPADSPLVWEFGVGGAYQIPISLGLIFELGAGFDYLIQSANDSETLGSVTITVDMFSIDAYAEINVALSPNFFLNAGFSIRYIFKSTLRTRIFGTDLSADLDRTAFILAPYVGVAFSY